MDFIAIIIEGDAAFSQWSSCPMPICEATWQSAVQGCSSTELAFPAREEGQLVRFRSSTEVSGQYRSATHQSDLKFDLLHVADT